MKKSKKKNSTIFHWLWSQNAGNGILEAHVLIFLLRVACPGTPLEAHAFSDPGHGYAGPKTRAGISGTGILKI